MSNPTEEQLKIVEQKLIDTLSPDPNIRNPASDYLYSFPKNNPDEFVKSMVLMIKFTTNVDVC